jgi:hypothetical protein
MAEKLTFDIQVGGNQDQALGSLKAQLKEATLEVQRLSEKFGETSEQAVKAAERASELKDQIGFSSSLIDAFNPDAKFKSLTSSLAGVASGFAAVQGAIGLFGVESEAVEKTLLKVQSAMALSESLQNIGESIDSFKQLGTVVKNSTVFQAAYNFVMGQKVAIQTQDTATTIASTVATKAQAAATNTATVATTASSVAMKVLRGAILATGIGALVIALIAVVQNFGKIKAAILNAVPSLGKFASTVGNVINSFTDLIGVTNAASRAEQQRQAIFAKSSANTKIVNEGIERQIKLIQAQGAEQGKIDALRKQQINNELNDLKKLADTKGVIRGEEAKKYKDLKNDLAVIDATAETARREEAKRAAEKNASAANKYGEDAKKKAEADAKERLEAQKEALLKLSELNNAIFLSTFKNENDKKKAELEIAFNKEREEILANTKLTEETKNQLIVSLRTKLNTDLDAINQAEKDKKAAEDAKMLEEAAAQMAKEDDLEFTNLQKKFAKTQDDEKKQAAKDLADIDKKIAKNTTDLELERSLLDEKQIAVEEAYASSLITEEQYNSALEANAKARADIDKLEAEAKVKNAEVASQLLGTISDLVGKNTAAGKAAAIASTTIDTYLSAQKAYASQLIPGDPSSPIRAAIAAGIAIVGGIKNVKSILAVQTPNGGGGGSANISAPSLSGAPIAPAQPQAATTNISAQSINALGSQTSRAYVIESDVTSSQQRMAAIQQRARFG